MEFSGIKAKVLNNINIIHVEQNIKSSFRYKETSSKNYFPKKEKTEFQMTCGDSVRKNVPSQNRKILGVFNAEDFGYIFH